MDANVIGVINRHIFRAEAGLEKYGVTTEREDLTLEDWLQHAQDEVMDFAIYLERVKSSLAAEKKLLDEREKYLAEREADLLKVYDAPDGQSPVVNESAEDARDDDLTTRLAEAVIWMSGSPSFGPGGEAHERWREIRDTTLLEWMDRRWA